MITRRTLLQLVALKGLGALSFSANAVKIYDWSPGLVSLEPIAHSLFGQLPLTLSRKTQIECDCHKHTKNGKVIRIPGDTRQTPITIRNIDSPKLILAIQNYEDLVSHTVAVYSFSESFGNEINTRINMTAFSTNSTTRSSMHRVWALTESDNKILCSYDDIYNQVSGY